MGNYCNSGQKKADADNTSEKSDDSPSYQLAKRTKDAQQQQKEAPLADPEPLSDVSAGGTVAQHTAATDETVAADATPSVECQSGGATAAAGKQPLRIVSSIQSGNLTGDSSASSPLAVDAPCDVTSCSVNLPENLQSLSGKATQPAHAVCPVQPKKIILYILAADDDNSKIDRNIIATIYQKISRKCASRGFELHLSNPHEGNVQREAIDTGKWVQSPLEACGGHLLAAICNAEINRHSQNGYVVPLVFLGGNLGNPLLPLTIDEHDFAAALSATGDEDTVALLHKWYPDVRGVGRRRHCLATAQTEAVAGELANLLDTLVIALPEVEREKYVTTVVEQELNATIMQDPKLYAKRCIWIQNAAIRPKTPDIQTQLQQDMNRRFETIQACLKQHLPEKNIIRIMPKSRLKDAQFSSELETALTAAVDHIMADHLTKETVPKCTYGVDRRLLNDIDDINRWSRVLSQHQPHIDALERLKNYLNGTGAGSDHSFVVYGPMGCGKSVLTSHIAKIVHFWLPDCGLVLRYAGMAAPSGDAQTMFASIAEQVAVLRTGTPYAGSYALDQLMAYVRCALETSDHRLVVVLDSIDDVTHLASVDWMPRTLSRNCKLILTVTSDAEDATGVDEVGASRGDWLLKQVLEKCGGNVTTVRLAAYGDAQWTELLETDVSYVSADMADEWRRCEEKLALQAKILLWMAWIGNEQCANGTALAVLADRVFAIIEERIGAVVTKFLFSLILASREGIAESEIVLILLVSNISECPPHKVWINFCWLMGTFLVHSGKGITMADKYMAGMAKGRYKDAINRGHKVLHDYFARQDTIIENKDGNSSISANTRKLLELPYHTFNLNPDSYVESKCVTDLQWIYEKMDNVGSLPVLSDLNLCAAGQSADHIMLLKSFIEINLRSLNYDARQFYPKLNAFFREHDNAEQSSITTAWYEATKSYDGVHLRQLNIAANADDTKTCNGYDVVMNLDGKRPFVISMSTEREELCVWNVPNCEKVRTLIGAPQPTSICTVDEHEVAVLCRREIKVIDLDDGQFKVTLKGVMNQKMPYFGIHDRKHLVCLSRNRMYVNLMNLETGDCVTTFKAGEDRFLNSLLVSGDGRILVCGDETQKPFPLLVWHLSQRKLLYDLRIPHHDFLTSLSAITHEGSYVCVVAKELAEPSPNFIVVYDLQSGTLFKKWKPSCNTVSLAISQTNACVIAGLEDARILVWDLVTGNCKHTLEGHNAPVTYLKLDPTGKYLLSGDKDGHDLSIRLWNLMNGTLLAAYTPPARITTCEILAHGRFVVIGMENVATLVTLRLENVPPLDDGSGEASGDGPAEVYGKPANEGVTFRLSG